MTIDKQQLRALAERSQESWRHAPGDPWYTAKEIDDDSVIDRIDAAFIAAASPSTVLALLDEIAEVLAERDAMQSMLTQATRERDEARRNYQFMVARAADEKLDGYRELGERAAKAENERDAVIARAETILGDRDLGIRRIAELTARAEKAERERDEAKLYADRMDRTVGVLRDSNREIERRTAEAIAAWLDDGADSISDARDELTDAESERTATIYDAAEQIRDGAWRKP